MKKFTSLILTIFLLISLFPTVYAEQSGSIVFSLECNGKNVETVRTGTEITVKCYLKNNIDSGKFKVYSLTNEVDFDSNFFEYIGNTESFNDKISVYLAEYSGNLKAVRFGGDHSSGKNYENKQYIGSFVLKVKAESGESVIKSDPNNATVSGKTTAYQISTEDLRIIVGDNTVDTRTLTFNTNGGSETEPITKNKGETVNLSECPTPVRSGYDFVGWCSDSALTEVVTSVTLNENTTVYAKWEKESSGGGSVGNSSFKITFETNGGTEVAAVSKSKNTTVDLAKYITSKEGFDFDGWYSDEKLTQKVSEIKVTANITVYAKWIEKQASNSSTPSKPSMLTDKHTAYIVGREDGSFCPNDRLTRAEAAEMIYRLLDDDTKLKSTVSENTFGDVNDDDWFNTSVSTLAKLEIIRGRSADVFAPQDQITRAEFTAIMARFSGKRYDGEDLFSDISGHWAQSYINIAASINWVQGENGIFRPDDNITRAEVVTLINRALNRQPESKSDLLDDMITPSDNTDENAWYYLAVQEAVNSHNYELKTDGVHEKWTGLTENPNLVNSDK